MDFWEDAKRTPVTWNHHDPRLRTLMAETRFPGLYALAAGELVLKVGTAGYVRKGITKPNTVAARLDHHLRKINRASHPAWWEFTDALGGRDLTIYTLRCDFPTLTPKEAHWRRRELEDAAIREAKARLGGVLWEDMQGRERNDRPVTPGKKNPRVLVEPGAVRRRLLGSWPEAAPRNPRPGHGPREPRREHRQPEAVAQNLAAPAAGHEVEGQTKVPGDEPPGAGGSSQRAEGGEADD